MATLHERRVLSASSLSNNGVRNAQGESIGKIYDIMIDVPTGRVAYAVLSFGGFLGLGDKLFAIPWGALSLDQENQVFVLNVSRQQLEEAEGFHPENWPDMTSEEWSAALHSHYGMTPYWD